MSWLGQRLQPVCLTGPGMKKSLSVEVCLCFDSSILDCLDWLLIGYTFFSYVQHQL